MFSARSCLYPMLCVAIISCGQKQDECLRNSITLISIGMADSVNTLNKGFGFNTYCYVDLENDSVYTMHKNALVEPKKLTAYGGIIRNLSDNDTIENGLLQLEKLPDGKIKGTEIPENAMYSGPTLYLRCTKNSQIKYYTYTFHHLDSLIENMTLLLFNISDNSILKNISNEVSYNEDSIIIPIIKLLNFKFNPPPRLKTTVKFEAPEITEDSY